MSKLGAHLRIQSAYLLVTFDEPNNVVVGSELPIGLYDRLLNRKLRRLVEQIQDNRAVTEHLEEAADEYRLAVAAPDTG